MYCTMYVYLVHYCEARCGASTLNSKPYTYNSDHDLHFVGTYGYKRKKRPNSKNSRYRT